MKGPKIWPHVHIPSFETNIQELTIYTCFFTYMVNINNINLYIYIYIYVCVNYTYAQTDRHTYIYIYAHNLYTNRSLSSRCRALWSTRLWIFCRDPKSQRLLVRRWWKRRDKNRKYLCQNLSLIIVPEWHCFAIPLI